MYYAAAHIYEEIPMTPNRSISELEARQCRNLDIDTSYNIPQAGRGPALPVFRDSSLSPLPRSSVPAWITTVRYGNVSTTCASILWISLCSRSTHSNDTMGSNELDVLVLHGALGIALAIRLEVSKVTDMTSLIGGSAVGFAMWVDY